MAFWNTTALDPKREFKFKVTFSRLGAEATFLAQTADRPVWTVSGETKVDFLDKSFNFPGKIKWNDVKVKFIDAAGAGVNVSRNSYTYLLDAGWIDPNRVSNGSTTRLGTISKASATAQAGLVTVQTLDGAGNAIDIWSLNNAFITTVGLNPLNYGGEAMLTAEYTFKYDWASYSANVG